MHLIFSSISILLLSALIASVIFRLNITPSISLTLLTISFGMAIFFIIQKHWKSYQQAECTNEKMIRNLALDIIGLLLTMGVAMYVGRLAGVYFGLRSGFWFGLIAGFLGGFGAAWAVRSAWGRLVALA